MAFWAQRAAHFAGPPKDARESWSSAWHDMSVSDIPASASNPTLATTWLMPAIQNSDENTMVLFKRLFLAFGGFLESRILLLLEVTPRSTTPLLHESAPRLYDGGFHPQTTGGCRDIQPLKTVYITNGPLGLPVRISSAALPRLIHTHSGKLMPCKPGNSGY